MLPSPSILRPRLIVPALCASALLGTGFFVGSATAEKDQAQELLLRRITPIVEVARDAMPAVVFIRNEGIQERRDLFGRMFSQEFQGTGSGVVIRKEGFIITNYHVVSGAKKLLVSFDSAVDPKTYEADVVGERKEEDLALLRIRGDHDFPTIPIGKSSDLMLGETVIAIGNPMGQTHTVTQGIISGLHRGIKIGTQWGNLAFDDLIQTDTSINPGNSGGPLLNINGQLIGINNAMNPNAQLIGFAIPVDHVMQVVNEQLLSPDAARAWLGFEVQAGDAVLVGKVVAGSPADQAGLRSGDCIVAVAGAPVQSQEDYRLARVSLSPAREVELKVERGGMSRTLRLAPWDNYEGTLYERVGLKVETVENRHGSYVRIKEVRADGPGAEIGLKVGDVIDAVQPVGRVRVDSYHVHSRQLFGLLIGDLEPGTKLKMDVYRDLDGNGYEEDELFRGTLTVR
jgi:serine protease Do